MALGAQAGHVATYRGSLDGVPDIPYCHQKRSITVQWGYLPTFGEGFSLLGTTTSAWGPVCRFCPPLFHSKGTTIALRTEISTWGVMGGCLLPKNGSKTGGTPFWTVFDTC